MKTHITDDVLAPVNQNGLVLSSF